MKQRSARMEWGSRMSGTSSATRTSTRRAPAPTGRHRRLLEGDWPGQAHLHQELPRRDEEDARLLQGPRTQRPEVRLDHARVPPRDH
jgi:hypothetical protein